MRSPRRASKRSWSPARRGGTSRRRARSWRARFDEVSQVRGRLGAFERNVLQTNVRSLQSSFENLSASVSSIRDSDFAVETSELTRSQILSQSAQSTLAQANFLPQSAIV
ncbi:MAG: hypothetical protein HC881_21015 [Leptolyngbyaceae cyanobacterium SL_7_1]|nr:hypothetical protein [Leptolyngbyaceae cyanobacterium SL_7_1]